MQLASQTRISSVIFMHIYSEVSGCQVQNAANRTQLSHCSPKEQEEQTQTTAHCQDERKKSQSFIGSKLTTSFEKYGGGGAANKQVFFCNQYET